MTGGENKDLGAEIYYIELDALAIVFFTIGVI